MREATPAGYPDPLVRSAEDHERATREHPERPALRGRSRDLGGARRRAPPPAGDARDDRLRELRPAVGAGSGRLGADQQVRRGLPGAPLLRRLRGGRRRRAARDRPRHGAVRGRARERPGPCRRPGQQRRLHGADRTGRHDHGDGARSRRPPDARDETERLREALRGRRLPRQPRRSAGRHGRGRAARRGAPAEGDRRRLVGLPSAPRLRRLPRDRRRGRRQADGRHGPLRGAGRRRRAPQPRPARGRRHDDDPQDALRSSQRDDPLPRGARGGDRQSDLPGAAGGAADAHDRRQGGRPADRRDRSRSGPASGRRSPTRGRWRRGSRRPGSRSSPAAPTST